MDTVKELRDLLRDGVNWSQSRVTPDRLDFLIDAARAEGRAEAESRRASECDVLNTELRGNYRAAAQVGPGDDWRPAIRALVDGVRHGEQFAAKAALAQAEAERDDWHKVADQRSARIIELEAERDAAITDRDATYEHAHHLRELGYTAATTAATLAVLDALIAEQDGRVAETEEPEWSNDTCAEADRALAWLRAHRDALAQRTED